MGTRGAFGVRIDGKDKLTYNHFDSYLGGLGEDLVGQISKLVKNRGLEKVKELARELKVLEQTDSGSVEPTKVLTGEEIARLSKYANRGVSSGHDLYSLLRELQGKLDVILTDAKVMIDGSSFVNDSLFCEYAYVLNLDTEKFEVYKGFQQKRGVGRYAEAAAKGEPTNFGKEYWPVTLMAEIPLTNLKRGFAKLIPCQTCGKPRPKCKVIVWLDINGKETNRTYSKDCTACQDLRNAEYKFRVVCDFWLRGVEKLKKRGDSNEEISKILKKFEVTFAIWGKKAERARLGE